MYVATNEIDQYLPIGEALVELAQVEEERKEIDKELNEVIRKINYNL